MRMNWESVDIDGNTNNNSKTRNCIHLFNNKCAAKENGHSFLSEYEHFLGMQKTTFPVENNIEKDEEFKTCNDANLNPQEQQVSYDIQSLENLAGNIQQHSSKDETVGDNIQPSESVKTDRASCENELVENIQPSETEKADQASCKTELAGGNIQPSESVKSDRASCDNKLVENIEPSEIEKADEESCENELAGGNIQPSESVKSDRASCDNKLVENIEPSEIEKADEESCENELAGGNIQPSESVKSDRAPCENELAGGNMQPSETVKSDRASCENELVENIQPSETVKADKASCEKELVGGNSQHFLRDEIEGDNIQPSTKNKTLKADSVSCEKELIENVEGNSHSSRDETVKVDKILKVQIEKLSMKTINQLLSIRDRPKTIDEDKQQLPKIKQSYVLLKRLTLDSTNNTDDKKIIYQEMPCSSKTAEQSSVNVDKSLNADHKQGKPQVSSPRLSSSNLPINNIKMSLRNSLDKEVNKAVKKSRNIKIKEIHKWKRKKRENNTKLPKSSIPNREEKKYKGSRLKQRISRANVKDKIQRKRKNSIPYTAQVQPVASTSGQNTFTNSVVKKNRKSSIDSTKVGSKPTVKRKYMKSNCKTQESQLPVSKKGASTNNVANKNRKSSFDGTPKEKFKLTVKRTYKKLKLPEQSNKQAEKSTSDCNSTIPPKAKRRRQRKDNVDSLNSKEDNGKVITNLTKSAHSIGQQLLQTFSTHSKATTKIIENKRSLIHLSPRYRFESITAKIHNRSGPRQCDPQLTKRPYKRKVQFQEDSTVLNSKENDAKIIKKLTESENHGDHTTVFSGTSKNSSSMPSQFKFEETTPLKNNNTGPIPQEQEKVQRKNQLLDSTAQNYLKPIVISDKAKPKSQFFDSYLVIDSGTEGSWCETSQNLSMNVLDYGISGGNTKKRRSRRKETCKYFQPERLATIALQSFFRGKTVK